MCREGVIQETSAPAPQFCCELKTALKSHQLKKKKEEEVCFSYSALGEVVGRQPELWVNRPSTSFQTSLSTCSVQNVLLRGFGAFAEKRSDGNSSEALPATSQEVIREDSEAGGPTSPCLSSTCPYLSNSSLPVPLLSPKAASCFLP